MPDRQSILQALKNSSNSKFIKKLTPDKLLPSISKASELVEKFRADDPKRLTTFHSARIISQGSHFAYNLPTKRTAYRPLIISSNALSDLNLMEDHDLIEILSGKRVYYDDKIFPYSMAYAGFQFGQFAGQLGDGRIVNLFDLKDKNGSLQTLQIKGSGKTPFSRFGDGKALLRSSIKEFIVSESLYHIGIPSTRAVQLTSLPGTKALRNGMEPCASVCRFAPSWIRLGNFDLFRWKPNVHEMVKLSDYCIEEVFHNGVKFPRNIDANIFRKDYFPEENVAPVQDENPLTDISDYDLFYRHVVNLNAECVAYWQTYGFVNGVLNTDNTSIMGLSMDFGPFSFIDKFQPDFTSNHDDVMKRYSLAKQPGIIWWNLAQFAQSIALLIGAGKSKIPMVKELDLKKLNESWEKELVERANCVINLAGNEYKYRFTVKYTELMAMRLGINLDIDVNNCSDQDTIDKTVSEVRDFCSVVIEPLLKILQVTQIDYNNFFVNLQRYPVRQSFFDETNGINGLNQKYIRVFFNEKQVEKLVQYQVGTKGATYHGDSGETRLLWDILEELKRWTETYDKLITSQKERVSLAQQHNPLFIPRSWIFDEVINDLTERQQKLVDIPDSDLDTSLLQKLHLMSTFPYDCTKWEPTLRPDAQQRWSDLQYPTDSDNTKYMKQSSCSS